MGLLQKGWQKAISCCTSSMHKVKSSSEWQSRTTEHLNVSQSLPYSGALQGIPSAHPVKCQWLWPSITPFHATYDTYRSCFSSGRRSFAATLHIVADQPKHYTWEAFLALGATLHCTKQDTLELYLPAGKLLAKGNLISFLSKTVDEEKTTDVHLDSYSKMESKHNSIPW